MADPRLEKSFTISGAEKLRPVLEKWGRDGAQAIAAGLYEIAEGIMTIAKERTPVLTGTLRASGHVVPPVVETGSALVVRLGFGGAASGYALYVHERLDVHHPTGQAKFLESAVVEAMRTLEADLAKRAQVILRERGLA